MFPEFYLTYYAIGPLVTLIFTLYLGGFLTFQVKDKTPATRMLASGFFVYSLLPFGYFITGAFYGTSAAYHRWFTVFGSLLAFTFLIRAIWKYPEDKIWPRLGRWVFRTMFGATVVTGIYFAVVTLSAPVTYHFPGHYWDFVTPASRHVAIVLVLFLIFGSGMGFAAAFPREDRHERLIHMIFIGCLWVVAVLPTVFNLLSRTGALDRATYTTSFVLSGIVGFFVLIVVYINNTDERSTFMAKIVGVSLATILLIIQAVSYFSLDDRDEAFDDIYFQESQRIVKSPQESSKDYSYMVTFTMPKKVMKGLPSPDDQESKLDNQPDKEDAPEKKAKKQANKKDKKKAKGKGKGKSGADKKKSKLGTAKWRWTVAEQTLPLNRPEFYNAYYFQLVRELPGQDLPFEVRAIFKNAPAPTKGYARLVYKLSETAKSKEDLLQKIEDLRRVIALSRYQIDQLPEAELPGALVTYLEGQDGELEPLAKAALKFIQANPDLGGQKLRRQVQGYYADFRAPEVRRYRETKFDGYGSPPDHYVAYFWVDSKRRKVYEVGFDYHKYRAYIHEAAIRLFLILLGVLVVVLIGFRFFFKGSLVGPLNRLLDGVTEINKGNYDTQVPVKVQDEIGYLSGTFNKMVWSIREARKTLEDYAQNLETKVEERTKELQDTLDEVSKLKKRQDGDYFLTSLLLKPLGANRARSDYVDIDFLVRQKKTFKFRHWDESIGGDMCISDNINLKGRPMVVFVNADAMGKSMQGAGGCLVLGAVFNSIIDRTKMSSAAADIYPERWLKNSFRELHKIFESFDGSMLISLVMGIIDEENGMLYYINAEHPWTILYRDRKAAFIENELLFRKLGTQGVDSTLFVRTAQLHPGDVIIAGTDGRDDLLLSSEDGYNTIQEDENLILKRIEEADADLEKIVERLEQVGELTDDLAFLKITYHEKRASLSNQGSQEELEHLLEVGQKYFLARDYPEAEKRLHRVLTMDDHNAAAVKLLLQMSLFQKDYEQALEYARDYMALRPSSNDVIYIGSYCYAKLHQYKQAADLGERIRLREPHDVRNLLHLARVYGALGNVSRARHLLQDVRDVDPTNDEAAEIEAELKKAAANT